MTAGTPTAPVVLLYGDVDANILDGSAVWLGSMAEAWTAAGAEVHVLLKAVERRGVLTAALRDTPGVVVHSADPAPGQSQLSPRRAVESLAALADETRADVVLVRGVRVCVEAAASGLHEGRLWSYVTEFGYPMGAPDPRKVDRLRGIAAGSRVMLAQTEDARAVLEALVPEAAGRTVVLTPMIPDGLVADSARARQGVPQPVVGAEDRALRLVYTGKLARAWRTDRMPELVPALAGRGVRATLTMVGDKVHREPDAPDWRPRMEALMSTPLPGVTWAGGVSRAEALARTADADVALSWRSPALDASLELSTKVLEACALGVPPLLNRTAAHERLLGADWPLFVDPAGDDPDSVADVLGAARPRLPELAERAVRAAMPYRVSARALVLRGYLDRFLPRRPAAGAVTRRHRVVVAGHDLKFAGELLELLESHPGVELRIDRWDTLHRHDEAASREHVRWADTVLCEWAGPNAVWYAANKRPGQRLVTRLHMFELRGGWLADLDVSALDAVVTVSELYRGLAVERLGADPARVHVIPNAVSRADLAREPVPGREHRLGLVGMVPLRKRLDRAVDLLRELRREDDRFTLHVRGRMPWEYRHEWQKPAQREAYLDQFARLGADPVHRAVAFEPFGADMGTWLRRIGWVLSPSSAESFHLAPAEGMAAGAIPVLWDRPGAGDIFGADLLHEDTEAAARWILELAADGEARRAWTGRARSRAAAFDESAVAAAWEAVLGLD